MCILIAAGSRVASGCVCQATADTSDTTVWASIVQDGKYLDEQTTDALIAQTVIALGDKVHQAYPWERNIILCDNVRYYHAKIVRERFEDTNVEFRSLPAYLPNLNLIERPCKFMKAKMFSKYYPIF